MKIQRFNESLEKIEKKYNRTRYVVKKTSEKDGDHLSMPCLTIEDAVSAYNRVFSYDDNPKEYDVYIVEEKFRIVTKEEIELYSSTNKYNL